MEYNSFYADYCAIGILVKGPKALEGVQEKIEKRLSLWCVYDTVHFWPSVEVYLKHLRKGYATLSGQLISKQCN